MKFILVTGVKEIDRKTVVDLALQASGYKNKFKILNFDDMVDLSSEIMNTPDLDAARNLLSVFYTNIEKILITDLKEQKWNLIVNGYLTLNTPTYGYIQAIPEAFFKSFKPDMIVILEKYESERDLKTKEHQNINRYYGTLFSSLSTSTLKIIKFREDKIMDAVKELSKLIKH